MYIFTRDDESLKLHFTCGVIDAHCDTIHYFTGEKGNYIFSQYNKIGHIDLPRLEAGGIKVQFFALFVEERYRKTKALKRCLKLLDCYFKTVALSSEQIETVYCNEGLFKVNRNNKIAALLLLEGGESLEGSLNNLRLLYILGVRGIGLTWNYKNQIAAGIGEKTREEGLTSFGKEVICEMNRLGMLIDLAHIGEKGFYEVIELSRHPAIISHANAKAVCDHPRNLSNKQLYHLKQNGGVIGLTFFPDFIHKTTPTLEALLDHFEHISETVGVDFVGIGSDYDGICSAVKGLDDASFLPNLTHGLLSRGFSKEDIYKILYGNFERVLKKVLPAFNLNCY